MDISDSIQVAFKIPKVSVILCNYNYGRYVGQAIKSVLAQEYGNFELIIVDDGSTDNSREIIRSYAEKHLTKIIAIYQENKGQAAAFNAGFERARGKYCAFLDSDDLWKKDKLKKAVEAFEQGGLSVVQHNLEVIDEDSNPTGRIHPGLKPGIQNVLDAYFRENHTNFFSATSGIVCLKSILKNVMPLDPEWRICADIALTRPLPLFGNVCTMPELLGYYRIHGSNLWMDTEQQRHIIKNSRRYVEYTNCWLAKFGKKHIDLTRWAYYRKVRAENLPWYDPRKLWWRAKEVLYYFAMLAKRHNLFRADSR